MHLPRLLALAAAAATAVACSDAFAPTVANMAGAYTARQLLTQDASGAIDWIAAGATLTIQLAPDGTTSGRFFAPGADEGGGDLDEDMAGTWLLVGRKVQFGQEADTFIRDMDFDASKNRLSVDHTFTDGTRVVVVLTK